MTEVNKHLWA